MIRHLFNLLAVLSLLLCIAMVMLWVRSYYTGDSFTTLTVTGYYSKKWPNSESGWMTSNKGISTADGRLAFGMQSYGRPIRAHELKFAQRSPWHWRNVGLITLLPPEYGAPRFVNLHQRDSPPNYLGFGFASYEQRPKGWLVFIPFWFLVLVFAASAWSCRKLARWSLRMNRLRQGLCPVCAYNLRATPEQCPECGTVPEKLVLKDQL